MTKARAIAHGLRTRGGFDVGIKLHGDWFRLNALLTDFGPKMAAVAMGAQRRFAEKYRDRVKSHIRTGGRRFGYPPHSAAYSDYKSRKGGGGRLLFWSGAFHDAVQVMPLRGGRVGVGIASGEPQSVGRLSIKDYANVLEHGSTSRNIQPRPVFADTFKELKGIRGLRTYIQWNIIRDFNKIGIRLNRF